MATIPISPANPILTPGMTLRLSATGYTPPTGSTLRWSADSVTFTNINTDGTLVQMDVSREATQLSEAITVTCGADSGSTTVYIVTDGTTAENTTLVYGTDGKLYLMGGTSSPPEGILLTDSAAAFPDIVTNAITGNQPITNESAAYVACYVLNLALFGSINGTTLRKS